MEEDNEDLIDFNKLANEKIELAHKLIKLLDKLKEIDGVQRIQRRIKQEIKFLEKMKADDSLKKDHVVCSNIIHFKYLVKILFLQQNIKFIDYSVQVVERDKPLKVDIVCENGSKWVKVTARNSKSISEVAKGLGPYGVRSILDQADDFVSAAEQNIHAYNPPKIVFYFSQALDDEVTEALIAKGIEVKFVDNSDIADLSFLEPSLFKEFPYDDIDILNLDITTMITYVSEVTNGSCNWTFKEKILSDQAKQEKEFPVKPILDKLFEGKKLICCETALNSFKKIASMMGGPKEKQRATEFLKTIEMYSDIEDLPDDFSKLVIRGNINLRSLKIFAFGVKMKSLTVTANEGFVRSAKMQGVDIPVFIHQARALTELKEKTAEKIF